MFLGKKDPVWELGMGRAGTSSPLPSLTCSWLLHPGPTSSMSVHPMYCHWVLSSVETLCLRFHTLQPQS